MWIKASAPLPEKTGVPARARATPARILCTAERFGSAGAEKVIDPCRCAANGPGRPTLRILSLPRDVDFAAASPVRSLGDWLRPVHGVGLRFSWEAAPDPDSSEGLPLRAALLVAATGALMAFCTPFHPPARWPLALAPLLPVGPGDLDALALLAASVFGGSQACQWTWQGPVFHGLDRSHGDPSSSPAPDGLRVELCPGPQPV